MATTKNINQYITDAYTGEMDRLAALEGSRAGTDAALIEQIGQNIDAATAAAARSYEEQIARSPAATQALYNANTAQSAVAASRLQGGKPSSSAQTALAIQRENADRAVREQERAYTQQLENTLAQLFATSEGQKLAQAASIEHAGANRRAAAAMAAANNSAVAGANTYAAESAAEQDLLNKQHEWDMQEQKYVGEAGLKSTKGQIDSDLAYLDYLSDSKLQEGAAEQQALQTQLSNTLDNNVKLMKAAAGYEIMLQDEDVMGKDGAYSEADARVTAALRFGIGSESDQAWYRNYQSARDRGWNENTASVYANAGGGENGDAAAAFYEIGEKRGHETTYGALAGSNPLVFDVERITEEGWTQDDWDKKVGTTVNGALSGAKRDFKFTDTAAYYASAVTAGRVVKRAVTETTKKYAYNALCKKFSGKALEIALNEAGLTVDGNVFDATERFILYGGNIDRNSVANLGMGELTVDEIKGLLERGEIVKQKGDNGKWTFTRRIALTTDGKAAAATANG